MVIPPLPNAARSPSPTRGEGCHFEDQPSPLVGEGAKQHLAARRKRGGSALIAILLGVSLYSTIAHAVEPDEILADATLEARARVISAGLRCLVCQNQSIDDSAAPVARDLRLLIREQLLAQKSDAEVVDFVVARYGDYVLLKPRFTSHTAVLWLTPFAIVLVGGVLLWRRRAQQAAPDTLSDQEQAKLDRLLND